MKTVVNIRNGIGKWNSLLEKYCIFINKTKKTAIEARTSLTKKNKLWQWINERFKILRGQTKVVGVSTIIIIFPYLNNDNSNQKQILITRSLNFWKF